MRYENLKGKRYIALIRCSTDEQADTSIPDQLRLLKAFGEENEMVFVDQIATSVTGSIPGARTDLEQIIQRKLERNDFDVLLVQDISRLTRGGIEHGGKLEYDLMSAGIELAFAKGNMPEGDHAGILKSVEYFAAQQYAKSISFAVARGQMSALVAGRMVHCLRPPYGVDRLFMTLAGHPLHIIRNLPNGSQQKLDPTSGAVLETYPPPQNGASPIRYRKQKSENVVLVPGSADHVAAVRQMFRRKLLDGWGHWRVAKELNDQGIPSPNGKVWQTTTIKLMLRNPIYTGRGIANRRTQALYYERSSNAPTALKMDRQAWATQKHTRNRQRPREQWFERKYPSLAEFLGPELRPLAIDYQAKFLSAAASAQPKTINRDRHVDSSFILKGILRSKQGRHPMSGRTQGTIATPYRYYGISRACNIPSSDGTMRRIIRADAIEQAVLATLRQVLNQTADLRQQVEAGVRQQLAQVQQDGAELARLLAERDGLRKQVEFVIEELGTLGREAAKRQVQQLESKLAAMEERIVKAAAASAGAAVDVEQTVEQIMMKLSEIERSLDELPRHALRKLLGILISRLEVDMETKQFEMELALPTWAAFDASRYATALGLDGSSLQRAADETHASLLPLGMFDCGQSQPKCYECRRKAA